MKRDVKLTEGSKKARRSAARLAAVQVLYQIQHQDLDPKSALQEYTTHRLGFKLDGELYVPADQEMLNNIVLGVSERRDDIQDMTHAALDGKAPEQIDKLLLNILYAGTFEILTHHDIDAGIIISDYMNVSDAFFEQSEKKLVNAILDRLNKKLRAV